MIIPKDPYAKNTGGMDELVRLKLEIRLDESNAKLPAGNNGNDMIHIANDTERKIAILNSIFCDDNLRFIEINKENTAVVGNDINVKGDDNQIYKVCYKGTDFLIEEVSDSGKENFDFYFYYIGNNYIGGVKYDEQHDYSDVTQYPRQGTQMKILSPGESTPKLFN